MDERTDFIYTRLAGFWLVSDLRGGHSVNPLGLGM